MRRAVTAGLAIALGLAAWGDGRLAGVGLSPIVQVSAQDDSLSIGALLLRLERILATGAPEGFLELVDPAAERDAAQAFARAEIRVGATRTVVRERDRQPFEDGSAAGYRLVVDTFVEHGDRARAATWLLDIRRAGSGWRVVDQERLSSVDSLFRLSLDTTRRFRARGFTVSAEDLTLTLADGSVYQITADGRLTGLLLIGRGEMRFQPTPPTERRQVEIFAGDETLVTRFDSAYIRAADLDRHGDRSTLVEVPVERGELETARRAFVTESAKTYVLDLGDLSSEAWSLLPASGDFLAEVDTRRFDSLTYVQAASEPEDVLVFDRLRQRNISAYRSRERLAQAGRFYNAEATAAYEVLDYEVDAAFAPDRFWIDGRTRMRIRTRAQFGGQINVRLADSLLVSSVESEEFGRLFHLRVRGQNLVVVNLPGVMLPGNEFTLTLSYGGRLSPQPADRETMQAGSAEQRGRGVRPPTAAMAGEPTFLYSSRSYWYAQAPDGGYATARIRVSVPAGLTCVATGAPAADSPRIIPGENGTPVRLLYEFIADRPVRYLAFIVSRFATVDRVTLALARDDAEPGASAADRFDGPAISGAVHQSIDLTLVAHPLQVPRARERVDRTADAVLFYQSLIGDAPYSSFTLALVENVLPGGHSPAHFATLNQPLPNADPVWRTDPVNFPAYPDFFLAHEVAHQWWGQGVGWQNYHEQWLSEGIAHYFAALYAEHDRGPVVFGDLLHQMRSWAMDQSDQGPVSLGYRLGHVRSDTRIFRALVYNKGATVLHMLRRLVGDESFFRGLQRFYVGARYRRVGTEDLRHAMEIESDRSLERFFERWIHGAALPRLTYAYLVQTAPVHEVRVRLEQTGDLFDVPVTMTLEFADRSTRDVVIPVTEARVETRIPIHAPLRELRPSERDGTLAQVRRVAY